MHDGRMRERNKIDFNSYLDIFHDGKDVFGLTFKTIDQLKASCIYMLDTNVLLLPYTVGNKELHEIEKVYTALLDGNRLLIPSQVAKEFARNRPSKLQEIYQNISTYNSKISNLGKFPRYPVLGTIEDYQDALAIEQSMNKNLKELTGKIEKILSYTRAINWNDPVSILYSSLFSETCIIDNGWDYNALKAELDARHKFNIPPGYKDKSKGNDAIGDYIIWKDIQKASLDRDSDIVFVTGDEKADWFHQSMKTKLYPRFELIYEFKKSTHGKDFTIISLSQLMELYSGNNEVVTRIREVESSSKKQVFPVFSNAARRRAIHRPGNRCELCGAVIIMSGQGAARMQFHHITPIGKGGDYSADNLAILCHTCHKRIHNGQVSSEELIGRIKNKFRYGSPCEMSGQTCPACKKGVTDIVKSNPNGVTCSNCGAFFPASPTQLSNGISQNR